MPKDAYYFSHDANAQFDPKIERLVRCQGWAGYGLFWALIERLRSEADYSLVANYEDLAWALRVDQKDLKDLINDFGLFEVKDGVFFSPSLDTRMGRLDAIREKRIEAGRLGGQASAKAKAKQKPSKKEANDKQHNITKVCSKKPKNPYTEDFELWWKNYPKHRRVKKKESATVWNKSKLQPIDNMIETLKKQCSSQDWTKEGGQFVPHPTTYLRAGRWTDEVSEAPRDEKAGYNTQQLANLAAREELLRQDREAEMQEFKDETDSLPFS